MNHDFKITFIENPQQIKYSCKNCLTEFYLNGTICQIITPEKLKELDLPVECDRFLMEVNYENYN